MKIVDWFYTLRRGVAYLALPWFRYELPGWRRLCTPLGLTMGRDAIWSGLPEVVCRGKLHGYRMNLRMEDWNERLTYFLGRYDAPELQGLLCSALRPGDTFVDIGANIGMITLLAARCVGPQGRIFAFEPHPVTAVQLQKNLNANALKIATVFPIGLGDQEGALALQSVAQSSGWASFAHRPESQGLTFDSVTVPVRRADDVLPADLGSRAFIKIDAEGYECRILDGMRNRLQQHPAVVTELEPDLLRNAGSQAEALWERMTGAGYKPFFFDVGRRVGIRGILHLRPATIDTKPASTHDVLWLYPRSAYWEQLRCSSGV